MDRAECKTCVNSRTDSVAVVVAIEPARMMSKPWDYCCIMSPLYPTGGYVCPDYEANK